jgi:hypothetical protein
MSFKSKRKSKKVYKRTSKTRTSKTRTSKTRTSKTRTSKTRTSKTRTSKTRKRVKRRMMKGGVKRERELGTLVSGLKNQMFEFNKKNFIKNKRHYVIETVPTIPVSEFITEKDIDIVGPDFDPVRGTALQYVLKWHHDNPDNDLPPWQNYVGKLCEVPSEFFTDNVKPRGNLYDVKQNPANFNQVFLRDPTNKNITKIIFNMLDYANDENQAVDAEFILIPRGKYKFALLENNEIRYVADTDTDHPYYYLPAVILYFYNQGIISFDELKSYLGNELPHSILFNPRRETIMGAGDFTVDAYGYIVELTGYSGHTKPLPSNVIFAASKFIELGYPLEFVRAESVRLQTQRTDRSDINNRLFGTYLNVKYHRPPPAAAAMDENDI